jgi:translation initiation factor IF-1
MVEFGVAARRFLTLPPANASAGKREKSHCRTQTRFLQLLDAPQFITELASPVIPCHRACHHPAPSMPPRPQNRGTRSSNRNRYGPPKQSSKESEDKAVEVEGEISSVLAGTMFRVRLASGHEVLAHISGKMRKRFIRLVVGDKVKMEMSPYDLTKARIVFRMS